MQDNNKKEPQVGAEAPVVSKVAEPVIEREMPTEVKVENSTDKVSSLVCNPKIKKIPEIKIQTLKNKLIWILKNWTNNINKNYKVIGGIKKEFL